MKKFACAALLVMGFGFSALADDSNSNPYSTTEGKISSISFTVASKTGSSSATYDISSSTQITVDGQKATISDLKTDYYVSVQASNGNGKSNQSSNQMASTITATKNSDQSSQGKISSWSITLTDSSGKSPFTYTVNSETKTSLNGKSATFSELQLGQTATVQTKPNSKTATNISAKKSSSTQSNDNN